MQLPARIALWTIALALLAAVAGAQPDASDTKALGPITHESLARAGVTFDPSQSRGVFIGVNAYTSSLGATRPPNLKSCVNDAVDLAAAFWGLGLIQPAGITLVLSGTPSKPDSAAALERLRAAGANVAANARRDTIDEAVAAASAAAGPDGILFLAWSAHGFELNGVQYLTPENFYASADPPPTHEIQSRALSEATLASVAQRSPAARRVLLFDACRESKAFAPGIPQLIAGAAGMVTLYAVTSGELA
ncbi:MAG: caspase family protein, partial [Candidatus Sumerlaeia bacterium]|nr:caspase family protein [Candidatus Sumerlaeia bacterium]